MMQMHGPDTGNMDAKTHEEKQMEKEPMRNGKINGDICGEHNDGWGKLSQCFGHNGWGKNFNSRARQYCGNAVNDVVVRIKFVYFLVVSFLWPHRGKLAQVKWAKFHFLCIKSLRLKSSWAMADVRWQVIASFFFSFWLNVLDLTHLVFTKTTIFVGNEYGFSEASPYQNVDSAPKW